MNTNRSVLRTKKAIREAFIELLSEKQSVDKITIIELTERANIVRSTFYSHYDDIYAVAKEIQNELLEIIKDTLSAYQNSGMNDLTIPMNGMIHFFQEREIEYRKLFSSGYNEKMFMLQLKDIISKELFEKVKLTQSEMFNNDLHFEARFYAKVLIDMVCDYLRGSMEYNLFQIRDFMLRLINKLN